MKLVKGFLPACIITLMVVLGCDTIDCTLNNTVVMVSNIYQDGKAVEINDTLSITNPDASVVLLNSKTDASNLKLVLSYFQPVDTLVLTITGDGYQFEDTLWIEKTSYNHFESPDCPVNMFHHITEVRSTHVFIDSVSITQPDVNFAEHENLQIHLYSSAD
ncbi:MAG: hypothetical protein K6F47_11155 [Bacteroidaceae bacterium]|jgi:hypothetical protein|nr:hypothetical protein [Bacteroidaceae bacterium]